MLEINKFCEDMNKIIIECNIFLLPILLMSACWRMLP